MRRLVVVLSVALAAPAAAQPSPTGALEGEVALSRSGEAVADASGVVVYLVGFSEPPARSTPSIEQKNRTFKPDLMPITAGQSVAFPNGDPILHNVFSPSATRPFDLGGFKRGESKSKEFPKTGVVDVYCNIHPEMSATILVLPNRKFARTDARGRFRIGDVPIGTWKLYAYSRRAERPSVTSVTIAAGATTRATLSLHETRTRFDHKNKFGEPYREPGTYR